MKNERGNKKMKFKFDLQHHAEVATNMAAQDASQTANTTTDTQAVAAVQTDTQKAIIAVETALQSLKTASGDLITAEITGLETTLVSLKAKAEEEAKEIETDVKDAKSKFIIYEQTFAQKYGNAIGHVITIGLLIYIAGRLAGVI
jgi:transcription initiation factor IIF auxiliary subunit